MPIGEADAIVAARKYADDQGYTAWRVETVRTVRVVVGGYDCWRVMADDALSPGEPDWMMVETDGGQSYLVDVHTGACIGVGGMRGYTLFVPARGGNGQVSVTYGNHAVASESSTPGRRNGRSFLGRLFGVAEAPRSTRLTADEAVRLAAASPGVGELSRALPIATPHTDGDRTVWRVTSAGVGAQWWAEVDDATGQVGDVHHAPGR